MGATTTAFKSLLKQLKADYPELKFVSSDDYRWSFEDQSVYYDENNSINAPLLLHETAHGLLGHEAYSADINLIKLERDAWTKAEELAQKYSVTIAESTREDALDSYREWLHTRSLCPTCGKNGIQTDSNLYECLVCSAKWRVNDAKNCGLRRQLTT